MGSVSQSGVVVRVLDKVQGQTDDDVYWETLGQS